MTRKVVVKIIDGEQPTKKADKYEGDLESTLIAISEKFNFNLKPKTVDEVKKVVGGHSHD